MRRILVVNVNWLGDVIFSLPVFRALKRAYPDAHISCLAVPRVASILQRSVDIDEVFVYDERGRNRFLFGKLAVVRRLRQGRFDTAVLLHRSWSRTLLVWLAGIPRRVGYEAKSRGWMLTDRVTPGPGSRHRMDEYLRVVEEAGIPVTDRRYELSVNPDAVARVRTILHEAGLDHGQDYLVIHAGGNWDLKRWPAQRFRELLDRLGGQRPDVRCVLSGGPGDAALAAGIADGLAAPPIVLTGKTDLDELLALLAGARLVISGDSGPLHLAASTGTAVLGLFGPTRPELTGPRGTAAARILQQDVGCNRGPCYFLECPRNVCMEALDVDTVAAAAVSMLNSER